MKIAIYTLGYFEHIIEVDEQHENSDSWVRLSEPVEVEFVRLPAEDIVPKQLQMIDREIEEARLEAAEKIARLQEKRNKLTAITHNEQQD